MTTSQQSPSKASNIQPVTGIVPRYRPQYTAHLATPISHILFKLSPSPHYIQAEDIITLIDTTERLRSYVKTNQKAHSLFIQLMAEHFEKSPRERKTEIPLMIFADAETIFIRRIKRLRKLEKEYLSSRLSSGTEYSFSQSYMPNPSGRYLQTRISQKNISDLSEFQGSDGMDSSVFDVYQPAIESDVESQINAYRRKAESSFNEWLLLSGIRRPAPLDERDFTLETALKEIKEQDVTHLVVEERMQFRQLDEVKEEKGSQKQKGWQRQKQQQELRGQSRKQTQIEHLVSPLPYLVDRNLPLHIKTQVYKQLCKYSWLGVGNRMPERANKKNIRQKAEDLLQAINKSP